MSTILTACLTLAVAYLIVAGVLIYKFDWSGRVAEITARLFPYPAAIINQAKLITIHDLKTDLRSVRMFYENQDFSGTGFRVDFNTEDGKKRLLIKEKKLLNRMIENKIIETLAKERGIKITSAMISQEVSRKLDEYGNGQDVAADLKKLYGWTLADFEEKIVKPDMYREALEKNLRETDEGRARAKKSIEDAQADLKSRNDFAEAARKYSGGDSAKNGGELGWFSSDQMLPEIAAAAFSLKKGETSEIIESSLGFHIISLEDRKKDGETEKVRIKQIFARAQNFGDWLQEQEKKFKIYLPLKNFYWDKEFQSVEFRDAGLKEFENNLNKNSAGDISVLF